VRCGDLTANQLLTCMSIPVLVAKSSIIAVCFFAICTVLMTNTMLWKRFQSGASSSYSLSAFGYQHCNMHIQLNWEAPMGSDLVYSILSQNGTLI
jgi:hypothetical protein